MKHALSYRVFITNEEVLCFILDAANPAPKDPIIVYDGGKHATFYRTSEDVLLLDFLPLKVRKILKNDDAVIIIEADKKTDTVVTSYKVRVKHLSKNPFTDGLK